MNRSYLFNLTRPSVSVRIAVHSAMVLLGLILMLLTDPVVTLVCTGVAVTLVFVYLAWIEGRSSNELLTPLSYFFLWYALGLGVAAVHFGFVLARDGFASFPPIRFVNGNDLAVGYVLSLAGSLVIQIVYQFMKPAQTRIPDAPNRIIGPVLGSILFATGLFVIIVPEGLTPFSGTVATILHVVPYAVLMAIAVGSQKRKFFWLKLCFGSAVLLAANMLSLFPYKTNAMLSLFPLLIALWKKSRQLTIIGLCALPAFYLGVVAPIINNTRGQPDVSPMQRLSKGLESYDAGEEQFFGAQWDQFMARVFEPISIGFIAGETRTSGFVVGETMQGVVTGLVPRLLWPEKPMISTGFWFTTYLGYAPPPGMINTSTAMTAVGELYWGFALPGVLLGTAGMAALYGGLWRLAARFGTTGFIGMLLYFTVTLALVNTGDATSTMLNAVSLYAAAVPVLLWPKARAFLRSLMLPRRPVAGLAPFRSQ